MKWIFSTWGKDPRILAWDIWNEPDNMNDGSYGRQEPPEKQKVVEDLLVRVWVWAREKRPIQPLTSGVWKGDWSSNEKLSTMERVQLDHSDIISFHNYGPPAEFEQRDSVAEALQPADLLHRIHGSAQRQYIRRHSAHRKKI